MAKYEAQYDLPRLCKAIYRGRRELERPRENMMKMVEQYAGPYWSENAADKRRPLNLIGLYHQIMLRTLVPKNPRVMLSTFNKKYKPTVRAEQDWANQNIDRIDFAGTMRKITSNALYMVGIGRVALATPGDSAMTGWEVPAGMPTISSIDLDDWVHDISARDFRQCGFMGHRYRIPKEVAVKMLGKKAEALTSDGDRQFNQQGDQRISFLGRLFGISNEQEFEEMVTLWEIYLPRHGRVLTLADDWVQGPGTDVDAKPLLDQPWVGPYCGPYHILGFQWVNGNLLPKGMVGDLLDLDQATNESLRKMMRIEERMKEVALVDAAASEDGSRIVNAEDGEMVKVQNLRGINQVVFSGQHLAPIQAVSMLFKDLFSFMGGNLELLGGRSPQAKTAAQDKMLNENANIGVADLQETTIKYASDVLESWLWFHHHDPYSVQKSTYSKGRSQIVRRIYPNQPQYTDPTHKDFKGRPLHVREIPWDEMEVRVDPYSLQHQTPQSKMQFLLQAVTQIITPILPLFQSQGINLDLNTLIQKLGDYGDQPDLAEILTVMEPPQDAGATEAPHDKTLPQQTERTYTRKNVAQERGADSSMMATLLTGKSQGGASGQPQSAGAA